VGTSSISAKTLARPKCCHSDYTNHALRPIWVVPACHAGARISFVYNGAYFIAVRRRFVRISPIPYIKTAKSDVFFRLARLAHAPWELSSFPYPRQGGEFVIIASQQPPSSLLVLGGFELGGVRFCRSITFQPRARTHTHTHTRIYHQTHIVQFPLHRLCTPMPEGRYRDEKKPLVEMPRCLLERRPLSRFPMDALWRRGCARTASGFVRFDSFFGDSRGSDRPRRVGRRRHERLHIRRSAAASSRSRPSRRLHESRV